MSSYMVLLLGCLWFQLFDGRVLLVDPTHEEESICSGYVTVVTADGNSICQLSKHGGASLSVNQLAVCMSSVKQRWAEIKSLIESTTADSDSDMNN